MLKRTFDIAGASFLLLLTLPIMLVTALAVLSALGRPVIFRQKRSGLRGNPFVLYKFRTMLSAQEGSEQAIDDDKRLTKLGSWLRKSSLDELPELINVLRGDMSLVGPRPLLMEYLPLYSLEQMKRHDVRPGITGWAQVNGRNAISWDKKFEYDLWYVNNQSMWLDIKILWMTLFKVVTKDGISQEGHVTTEKFSSSVERNEQEKNQ